jgi:hypothetical protein
MPARCLLDVLPVELLHALFMYFLSHEIIFTFSDVSDYLDTVLLSYPVYCLNFKSIRRPDFELVCRRVQPEHVLSLTISDNDDTPGQSELFLNRFCIEQFTQLRSLTLTKIEHQSAESLLSHLSKLKHLRSFSFDSKIVEDKYWIGTINDSNESSKLNSLLLSAYDQLSPQLHRLYLNNVIMFESVSFRRLQHLKLTTCSPLILINILADRPTLTSLDICLDMNRLNFHFRLPDNQLTKLNLVIQSK